MSALKGLKNIHADLKKSAHLWWLLLIEPRSADEDERRREYILNVIILGSIAMLALLDVSVLYHSLAEGNGYRGISFAAFSVIPLFSLFLYALSRRGFFVLASYLLVGTYLLSNSYAAYEWGVDMETVVLSYALIIVIASILVGTRFAFLVTTLIGLFAIPMWYLQWNHLIPIPEDQIPSASDAAIFTVIYFLIVVVAWLSNREIEKSLIRARKSESELKNERDSLEIRVEERTRELRKSELQKIEHLYQFAEFGQLSSGLFHDLINLMNATALHNERALKETTNDTLENAFRMNKRIENFANAMRRQLAREEVKETFSLNGGIEQVIQLLSYKANKEGVKMIFEHAQENDPAYFGNPFKFHQVVMNLILNALESYESVPIKNVDGRVIEIRIKKYGGAAILSVHDNGCGIAPGMLEKIFEPFFTTKNSQSGIGIGLATVKKIVEQEFHGEISVRSVEGEGSAFTVKLPLGH